MKQETLTTSRTASFSEAELDSMVKLTEILASDLPRERCRVLTEGAEGYPDLAFGGGQWKCLSWRTYCRNASGRCLVKGALLVADDCCQEMMTSVVCVALLTGSPTR